MKCLQHDFDTLTRKYSLDKTLYRIYYAQDRVDSEITIFLAQLRCCASIDERTKL